MHPLVRRPIVLVAVRIVFEGIILRCVSLYYSRPEQLQVDTGFRKLLLIVGQLCFQAMPAASKAFCAEFAQEQQWPD